LVWLILSSPEEGIALREADGKFVRYIGRELMEDFEFHAGSKSGQSNHIRF
jgi:hypothetical protein